MGEKATLSSPDSSNNSTFMSSKIRGQKEEDESSESEEERFEIFSGAHYSPPKSVMEEELKIFSQRSLKASQNGFKTNRSNAANRAIQSPKTQMEEELKQINEKRKKPERKKPTQAELKLTNLKASPRLEQIAPPKMEEDLRLLSGRLYTQELRLKDQEKVLRTRNRTLAATRARVKKLESQLAAKPESTQHLDAALAVANKKVERLERMVELLKKNHRHQLKMEMLKRKEMEERLGQLELEMSPAAKILKAKVFKRPLPISRTNQLRRIVMQKTKSPPKSPQKIPKKSTTFTSLLVAGQLLANGIPTQIIASKVEKPDTPKDEIEEEQEAEDGLNDEAETTQNVEEDSGEVKKGDERVEQSNENNKEEIPEKNNLMSSSSETGIGSSSNSTKSTERIKDTARVLNHTQPDSILLPPRSKVVLGNPFEEIKVREEQNGGTDAFLNDLFGPRRPMTHTRRIPNH